MVAIIIPVLPENVSLVLVSPFPQSPVRYSTINLQQPSWGVALLPVIARTTHQVWHSHQSKGYDTSTVPWHPPPPPSPSLTAHPSPHQQKGNLSYYFHSMLSMSYQTTTRTQGIQRPGVEYKLKVGLECQCLYSTYIISSQTWIVSPLDKVMVRVRYCTSGPTHPVLLLV